MKKVLITSILIAVVLCSVFAGTHSVKAGIMPYTFQSVFSSEKGIQSTYSLGGSLAYEYRFDNNITVGFDTQCKTTWFKEHETNLTDIFFIGKAGYVFNLESIELFANGEFGLGLQSFIGDTSAVMPFGIELGCSYGFANRFKAFASVENQYEFTDRANVDYSNIHLNTNLGVSYEF